MNAMEYIQIKQQIWAKSQGINLIGSKGDSGEKNYTTTLNENLFLPMGSTVKQAFEEGDGNELNQQNGFPAKMQALHSSSALTVNVFQYWMTKKISTIASACGLCKKDNTNPKSIFFEKKFEIDEEFQFSPNIDVVIENSSNFNFKVFAIECKFTETYSTIDHTGLKEKYISLESIWNDVPNIYQLAQRISPNDNDFNYLHPAQLIKHILGLKRKYGKNGFRLLYLWYDTLGEEGFRHKEEIERFTKICKKDGVKIHSISYQELILRLRKDCLDEHSEYVNYLSNRYF
ncbi:MAG: hypothetical protein DDT42_01531 [candidate division WS2 bacterium]|uniref:Restriction endonuclease n=1 Tax=Psychracetigena formicireducens TaxID=2986056 RepID=A0A9E2BJ08_PSYF1|nr:hypothetical protein [Candidatus Psychracetigena formicireducens]